MWASSIAVVGKRHLKPRAQRCCRRKNPNKFQVTKPVTKKRRFGTMALFTPGSKSDSGSDVINLGSRVISFGKLPSYKYALDLCVAPNLAECQSSDSVSGEVVMSCVNINTCGNFVANHFAGKTR